MSAFTSTILITGGTTGIGFEAARVLAQQSPRSKIIICSRSDKDNATGTLNKLLQTQNKSSASSTPPQIDYLPLDLSSTSDVRSFVESYASKSYPPITSLLLNAGIQFYSGKDFRLSADHIETTFATNHVGHALLFFLLKSHLADNCRIVVTASGAHDPAQKTPIRDAEYVSAELLARPTDKEGYQINGRGLQRYASSKLANVLFTYALEKRLRATREKRNAASSTNSDATANSEGRIVCAMDPGLMPGTSLGRDVPAVIFWLFVHLGPWLIWLMKLILRSSNVHMPEESAKKLARLATESGEEATGKYFEGDREVPSSKDSHDEKKQEDLWRWTVDFLAKDEAEKMAFETF